MLCLRKSLSVDATANFLRTAQPRDTACSAQAALKPHLGFDSSHSIHSLKSRNTGKRQEACPQQTHSLSNRKSAHDLGQKRPRSWSSQTFPESSPTLPTSRIRIHLKTTKLLADQNRRKTILHNVSVHQIRPIQRAFVSSTTFPPPVNQLPTSAVGFGWHGLFCMVSVLVILPYLPI